MSEKPQTGAQQAVFFEAAARGDLATVTRLLEAGVDIDAANPQDWNSTALMKAVDNGHREVVQYLLAQGADVQQADAMDWPALAHAADTGRVEILRLLIEAGADIHYVSQRVDYGIPRGTALNIGKRHPEVVRALREAGAKE